MYLFKRGLLPNYFRDMFTLANQTRQRDWTSSDWRRVREKDRKASVVNPSNHNAVTKEER